MSSYEVALEEIAKEIKRQKQRQAWKVNKETSSAEEETGDRN